VAAPSAEAQVDFLQKLQRLLREGSFTASYKFALLLALCDLAVERGDDSGAALPIETWRIGEKFIHYYWRQAAPYVPRGREAAAQLLLQNTDKQAAIVRELEAARREATTLPALRHNGRSWSGLSRRVTAVVEKMPLWKLQTVGTQPFEFLYPNRPGEHAIELFPVSAFCLRRFHGLIEELVRGAWLRFVRALPQNQPVLGQASDLAAFLFGSDRADLTACRRVLARHDDRCFYCDARLGEGAVVDHFVPWSLYPVDLGHNFVLADRRCNERKTNLLAAEEHLDRWCERNERLGSAFAEELAQAGITADPDASRQVTRWAYAQASSTGALVWRSGKELVPLGAAWEGYGWLREAEPRALMAAEKKMEWEG
jgi:hypothetical protein